MSVVKKYSYLDWTPKKHDFIVDNELQDVIHEKGYKIIDCLSSELITQLHELYKKEHSFNLDEGGMFYSMYSKDKSYRKRVHEEIGALLKPFLDTYFKDYKNVINAFVIKLPGEKSEFYVHQDTTGLNEFEYSPLSLWIPLHDITQKNGALALIEKSHWFFSPYRSISMPFPFQKINETIKKYLKPLFMKKGEVLFFDNRVIHNSLKNESNEPRVAIICGVFPEKASFLTCFHDVKQPDSAIELIEHDENFLLEFDHFFYDCTQKPNSGEVIGSVKEHFPEMSASTFEELCDLNDIAVVDSLNSSQSSTINCDLIAEPDGVNIFTEVVEEKANKESNKSIISRILNKFKK
jgi:hypothetical protein